MSGRIRPNSNKIVTHPKRERRRQRAKERLEKTQALDDLKKLETARLLDEDKEI